MSRGKNSCTDSGVGEEDSLSVHGLVDAMCLRIAVILMAHLTHTLIPFNLIDIDLRKRNLRIIKCNHCLY